MLKKTRRKELEGATLVIDGVFCCRRALRLNLNRGESGGDIAKR